MVREAAKTGAACIGSRATGQNPEWPPQWIQQEARSGRPFSPPKL
jgi:hypothetical protein